MVFCKLRRFCQCRKDLFSEDDEMQLSITQSRKQTDYDWSVVFATTSEKLFLSRCF